MKYWYDHGLKWDKEIEEFIVSEYLNKHKSIETIATENNWRNHSVRKIYKSSGNKMRTDRDQALKFTCNENYFEVIDTPEKAYWLGFLYADGFIQSPRKHSNYKVGITLTGADKGHLEKFKKAIEFTGEIKTYNRSATCYMGTKPYSRILVSSNKMAMDLIKLGCKEHKTEVLEYPNKSIIPSEFEKDFVRGCIDGDGSIILYSNGEYGLKFTGTKSMCKGILKFLEKENLKLSQRHPERPVDNYNFSIGGRVQVKRIATLLYQNTIVYLDRKYERYLKMLE